MQKQPSICIILSIGCFRHTAAVRADSKCVTGALAGAAPPELHHSMGSRSADSLKTEPEQSLISSPEGKTRLVRRFFRKLLRQDQGALQVGRNGGINAGEAPGALLEFFEDETLESNGRIIQPANGKFSI